MRKTLLFLSLCSQAWSLSCSTPVTLSQPGQSHFWPEVTMNENGEAVVLWEAEDSEEEKTLFAATMNAEKEWSSCAALSEPIGHMVGSRAFIDEQGNAYALWQIYRGQKDQIETYYQFAKKEKHNTWSSVGEIFGPKGGFNWSEIVHQGSGNLLFLSFIQKNLQRDVGAAQFMLQSGEKKLTVLSKDVSYGNKSCLVKNSQGAVLALWSESKYEWKDWKSYSSQILKGAWSQVGSNWSDPFVVYNVNGEGNFKKIKAMINSHQDTAALWTYYDKVEEVNKIQAAACFDKKWSEPMDFATSKYDFLNLEVALNNEGNIVAAWSITEGKNDVIYVAEKSKGQSWSSPLALSDTAKDARETEIAIDGQGNIMVVWIAKERKQHIMHAAYKAKGQDWSSPVAISNRAADSRNVKLLADNSGHFVVVWDEQQKKQTSVHGATLSVETGQWSSALLSPEGQDWHWFDVDFNQKGQGVIAWNIKGDNEEMHVQAAELKID